MMLPLALGWLLRTSLLVVALALAASWLRVLVDAPGSAYRAMPPWGDGYRTHSFLASAAGRQYVRAPVRALLLEVFGEVGADGPFILGETGWRGGGRLWPHRTHRAGLSVDIFVPLIGPNGEPRTMPCRPWNVGGYALELDDDGRLGDARLDAERTARLLLALHRRAPRHGLRVERVIFAPEYRPALFATETGRRLGALRARFMPGRAWVRHDEHLHVDFERTGRR